MDVPVIVGDRTGGAVSWTEAGGTTCDVSGRLYCFGTDVQQAVTVTPASGRRAFTTRATWGGGGGLGALDALCAQEAAQAGLAGEFHALAADRNGAAVARFDLGGQPWVRPDGVQIVRNAADLAGTAPLLAPIAAHADGSPSTSAFVWTGAPTVLQQGSEATTCAGWTDSTSRGTGVFGWAGSAEQWFGPWGATSACDQSLPVYCLQR